MNSDAPILGIGLLTWHALAPARRSGAGVEVVQSSSAPPLRPGLTRVGTSPPTRRDTRFRSTVTSTVPDPLRSWSRSAPLIPCTHGRAFRFNILLTRNTGVEPILTVRLFGTG